MNNIRLSTAQYWYNHSNNEALRAIARECFSLEELLGKEEYERRIALQKKEYEDSKYERMIERQKQDKLEHYNRWLDDNM